MRKRSEREKDELLTAVLDSFAPLGIEGGFHILTKNRSLFEPVRSPSSSW